MKLSIKTQPTYIFKNKTFTKMLKREQYYTLSVVDMTYKQKKSIRSMLCTKMTSIKRTKANKLPIEQSRSEISITQSKNRLLSNWFP